MEKLEIILVDFKKKQIDELVHKELKLLKSRIKSSHFYDTVLKKDLTFGEVGNFVDVFSPKGTGSIFLESLDLGEQIKEVIFVFSFDEEVGDIVINFPQNELFTGKQEECVLKLKRIINYIISLKKRFDFSKAVIGYEPAEDEDTQLITIYDQIISDQEIKDILSY